MTIEYISSETVAIANGAGTSESCTVPADCTLALITYCGWSGAGDDFVSGTLGGESLTLAESQPGINGVCPTSGIAYLVNPPTGSQTLIVTIQNADNKYSIGAHYFKGGDTSNPLRDTANTAQAGSSPFETPSFNVSAGDLAVVLVGGYTENPEIQADPPGKGQTEIWECKPKFDRLQALGTKSIVSGTSTTMWGGGCSYNGLSAISLVPATAGPVEVFLTLEMAQAISQGAKAQSIGDTSLNAIQQIAPQGQAQVTAALPLTIQEAMNAISSAATAAGVAIEIIAAIQVSGTEVAIVVAPAERTFIVPAESRAFKVEAESRAFIIPAEDRTFRVN